MRPIPIRSEKGAVIGRVADGVFSKSVDGSIHMLHSPPAWAVDLVSIKAAVRAGAKEISIYDRETGVRYTSSIDNFREHHFVLNRGHSNQVALPLERWSVIDPRKPLQERLF